MQPVRSEQWLHRRDFSELVQIVYVLYAVRMRCRISLFLLGLLVALPVFAYRREYAVTWDGQRKGGSEVCFYRGERGDAFDLFFTPGDVRCLSADAILDFPP